MGKCCDCLHWSREYETECKGWGHCAKGALRRGKPSSPPTTALATDESGYEAWLETAPTHGCTMFEAKE